MRHLLYDLDQVLQNLATLSDILVCDDCCGEVTQDVWAHGLNSIEVSEMDRVITFKLLLCYYCGKQYK